MSTPPETPSLWLRIPPPVWLLAFLVAAYFVDRLFDWTVLARFISLPLAVILGVCGIGLTLWGRLTFHFHKTDIMPTSPTNSKLVTSGPFRLTRNPMYSGMILLTLGIAFYAGTLPFFAVPVAIFALCDRLFVPFEEAKMARQYGKEYEEYRGRVRRWI